MKLQDIFDQLTFGELSQLSLTNEGQGINEEDRKKVIRNITLGLTELHKRFLLKERFFDITLQKGKVVYTLVKRFAESNISSTEPVKYISDLNSPFYDDLLKIEQVTDENGNKLTLNKSGNKYSLRTPAYNVLYIPPQETPITTVNVVYRADHPPLSEHAHLLPPFTVDIDLPGSHLQALLYFVASRILNPIGLVQEFHEGNNYTAKFEAAVQELKNTGFQIDTDFENNRFTTKGFV